MCMLACMCVCVCLCRYDDAPVEVKGQSQVFRCQCLPSTFFKATSLVHCFLSKANWLVSFHGFACLCLSFCYRHTEVIHVCYHIWLYMGSGNQNQGLHTYTACILSTETFSKPYNGILYSCVLRSFT